MYGVMWASPYMYSSPQCIIEGNGRSACLSLPRCRRMDQGRSFTTSHWASSIPAPLLNTHVLSYHTLWVPSAVLEWSVPSWSDWGRVFHRLCYVVC